MLRIRRYLSRILHCASTLTIPYRMFGVESSTRNIIHVGLGFVCIFFAFNTQGFIEETVINAASKEGGIDRRAGYYSLAIIYAFAMLGNLVVAPVVDFLGARISMSVGGFMFTLFLIGMVFLNEVYLYMSSALLGLGSALIWTGQGKYLALNSSKERAGRNSALLWGLLQTSLFLGGIFLFIVFSYSDVGHISTSTRRILYGVFSSSCFVGNIILLLVPVKDLSALDEPQHESLSNWKMLSSAFWLACTPRMLLLSVVFAYSGLELSFWSGIFTTCISFTSFTYDSHRLVALNAICQGLGQVVGGFCFGIMGDRFRRCGRNPIIIAGYLVHIMCFIFSFISFPTDANLHKTSAVSYISPSVPLALVIGALLGFGDACWNTQIYSILVDLYNKQSAQAFSIMKFFQAAFACGCFFYSAHIELPWILLILAVFSTVATACFFYVERYAEKLSMHSDQQVAESSDRNQSQ